MSLLDNTDILVALQREFPLSRAPFAELATRFGLSVEALLAEVRAAFQEGSVRRFGGVFDVRRLGYRSTLCAVTCRPEEADGTAARLVPHPGITHCYRRGWPDELPADVADAPRLNGGMPPLWFTLSGAADSFDRELEKVAAAIAPHRLLSLPAVRRFKIDVVFDPQTRDGSSAYPGNTTPGNAVEASTEEPAPPLSEQDTAIVKVLQGDLPLVPAPFDEAAQAADIDPDALLARLRAWQTSGVLRRVGLILNHRRAGFTANGMCTWRVNEAHAQDAGRRLAESPHVTHCYQRQVVPAFPYNLFAMIHSSAWTTTLRMFHELSWSVGLLTEGCVLFSLKEYKKTSPRYFQ